VVSYEEAKRLRDELDRNYQQRHAAFKKLRDFWHGRHWDQIENESRGIASLFRDMRNSASDVGPDLKVVHNVLKEVVDKYQTFLSPTPMIQVYVDPPSSEKRKAAATRKERFLYGCWSENNMNQVLGKLSWYLPVFGDSFLGVWPDMEKNMPRVILRSPEHAFPFHGFEGDMKGVIFSWKVRESALKRDFPKYQMRSDRMQGKFRRGQSADQEVELMEYSDGREFARWADDQKLNGIEHHLGFNLFDQVQFLNVPDEPWGHGAIEQYVGLNEMGNALKSLLFQAAFDSVFPTLVLVNPSKFSENLERGPGAVIGVNEGGDAKYLAAPVQGIMANNQFAANIDHNIRVGTGQPEVNFGQSPASSVATGKAINELQGAATGAMVEHVQGLGIGHGLVSWNEKAITMAQTMFREERIHLFGSRPESSMDIVPQRFAWSGKGSDLVGSPRNEVIFSPHLSVHEKLVMGLQAAGGGLVSKQWQRNNIGIPDNEAMVEEIVGEVLEDGVIGAIIQAFQQDSTPEGADTTAGNVSAFLNDLPNPAPHPLLAQGAGVPTGAGPSGPPAQGPPQGGGGPPVGPISPGAPGQAMSPALQLPPGSPPPGGAPPPQGGPPQGAPPDQGGGTVSENEVAAAFASLQGIKGRVFLVGEIVVNGQTAGDIEVSLTDDDRDAIASALPQYAARFIFHHVTGQPKEQFVEVTPGSPAKRGDMPDEQDVSVA
jgi:hypothetical protein